MINIEPPPNAAPLADDDMDFSQLAAVASQKEMNNQGIRE